jgi:23S rRNA U2552 (ribose-2'-O)-methylase RlmE/FtsJ
MLSFKLSYDGEELPINNIKKYSSKTLKNIKDRLAKSKSQLDIHFENNVFPKYWREFDPFKSEKSIVAEMGCTFNVTNAWLKCYEMVVRYELIPEELKQEEFLHFDNAAFPGSFMTSVHHYVMTKRKWSDKYRWIASSLIEKNDLNAAPLEDKYKLYSNYPDKWLMNEENNGDVLVRRNQREFYDKIGGTVDLYTSDLGFDVSSDYNNQELMQAPANIGQIISGIITLKKGGCFITKQYMVFEMITVSVMFALSQMFEEFYLCKPITSREANSETYLVGKGFKGAVAFEHPYVQAMFDRIEDKVSLTIPLFDAKHYPKQYLKDIIKANTVIFEKQMEKIDMDVKRSLVAMKKRHSGRTIENPVVVEFRESIEVELLKWYKEMEITPIDEDKRLNMKDSYHQR